MADPIHVNLRSAPEFPRFDPRVTPEVRQSLESIRQWCRDAEKSIRTMEQELNRLRKINPP